MSEKCQDETCGYNVKGECRGDNRFEECRAKELLSITELREIRDYLLEVRQKYLKPYREKDCLKIEVLCQKIEAIIKKIL